MFHFLSFHTLVTISINLEKMTILLVDIGTLEGRYKPHILQKAKKQNRKKKHVTTGTEFKPIITPIPNSI